MYNYNADADIKLGGGETTGEYIGAKGPGALNPAARREEVPLLLEVRRTHPVGVTLVPHRVGYPPFNVWYTAFFVFGTCFCTMALALMWTLMAQASTTDSACNEAQGAIEQEAQALSCSFDPDALHIRVNTLNQCRQVIEALSFKDCSNANTTAVRNTGLEIISAAEPAVAAVFNTGVGIGAGLAGVASVAIVFAAAGMCPTWCPTFIHGLRRELE